MKKSLLAATLLACLSLACKAPNAPATPSGGTGPKPAKQNPVVVVLEMDKIMGESQLSKDLHAELKSWADGKQAELRARGEAIRAAEASKSAKPADLDAMKREIMEMQEMAKQEYQQRQMSAAERMKQAFGPLVVNLAKENGWDVVMNKSSEGTIYTGEALDQTDYVLAKLNASTEAKAPATSPAPAGQEAPAAKP
jgi:Skp family chaperone for outer membrane proteins